MAKYDTSSSMATYTAGDRVTGYHHITADDLLSLLDELKVKTAALKRIVALTGADAFGNEIDSIAAAAFGATKGRKRT